MLQKLLKEIPEKMNDFNVNPKKNKQVFKFAGETIP